MQIPLLQGGVMETTTPKALYPFILTILSIVEGNREFTKAIYADVQTYFALVEGDMHHAPSAVRYMYLARQDGKTLAELVGPIMFDPAFILQIIAETGGDPEMGHKGKGNIWQWSGVQQHADISGSIRPVISWI